MPLLQILLTAASLAAVASGTWGVDRLIDRYGRIPAAEESAAEPAVVEAAEEDEESRLLY